MDIHPTALLGLCHHALGFQIRLILIAGFEFFFVDLVRFGEGFVDVAFFVLIVEKDLVRLAQIEHRLKLLVFDRNAA